MLCIIGPFWDFSGWGLWQRLALTLQFWRFRGLRQPRWYHALAWCIGSCLPLSSGLVGGTTLLCLGGRRSDALRPVTSGLVVGIVAQLCTGLLHDAGSLSSAGVVQNGPQLLKTSKCFLLQ